MRAKILIVFAALFFSGCVTVENPAPQPQPKPNPPATELILESTATRSAPTLAPIATRPAPTSEPTLTSPTTRVKIFLIALEDNGKTGKKIGCNDSAVAVERVIPATTAPLRAALEELFSLRDRNYGQSGLYNVLYQSNLKLESASIAETKATIHISGALRLSGICDNPRVEAQIEQTALQFSTVKSVDVFLNNVALEKVLSQK
ncbi:MAG: GerMN domain-containing protein [Chloroflexi bacterium]|nr:GerMN domain-containing protein [Chloroflexota bacterium]